MHNQLEEKLRNYLNLYWLRPENGLLCAFKSKAFENIAFDSPSLDISCGDGLFMFLHLGGEFDSDFDYFQSTKAREFKHSKFVDIYDAYTDTYQVKVKKQPGIKLDAGTDWKQALLNKTTKLDLYQELILHDNNIVPLPFDDNRFKTIYSNSIYWVTGVEQLLFDIYRILQPGGTAALEVMTPYFLETLDDMGKYLTPDAIAVFDRNRRATMPGCFKYNEWKELMIKTGFKVEVASCVYPHKILVDIWNIGLRPISHLLIQMSDTLNIEERHRIKSEWVDIFHTIFKPLLAIEPSYSIDKAPYIMFILKK